MSNWLTLLEAVSRCFQNRPVFPSGSSTAVWRRRRYKSAGMQWKCLLPSGWQKMAKLEDSEDPKDRHVDFNIFNRKPSETNSTQGRRHQGAMPHLGAITLWLDQEIPTRQVAKSLQNHLDLWENLLKTVLTAMFGHKSCLLHPLHCSDCTPLMITLSRRRISGVDRVQHCTEQIPSRNFQVPPLIIAISNLLALPW